MKELKTEIEFKLKMFFIGEYPQEKVKDLMNKVADALYHEYLHGEGFSPEDSDDCMTDTVTIKCGGLSLVDRYYVPEENGNRNKTILDFTPHDD